jgi:hypothetical protein
MTALSETKENECLNEVNVRRTQVYISVFFVFLFLVVHDFQAMTDCASVSLLEELL